MKNKIHTIFGILIILFGFAFTSACQIAQEKQTTTSTSKIKNVILVIGDGMGPQQIGLLQSYANLAPNSVLSSKTAFDRMLRSGASLGLSTTNPNGMIVVDSAASASQLATGEMSGSEMIGLDKDGIYASTVLEYAKKQGKAVGLVSDTRITHATPAAFAAHVAHRSLENEIAEQMLKTNVDVMLSGGLRYWIPKSSNDKSSAVRASLVKMTEGKVRIKSKRKDEKNLIAQAKKQGFSVAFTKEQMQQSKSKKILGLFAYSALNDGIENTQQKNDNERTEPTLEEMTTKAIDTLSQNEKGFFLMVEAGQIDWAGHYNDSSTMLHEMLKINDTLNTILDWAQGRDDTIVIVTADHETGGFGFSYSAHDLPKAQKLAGKSFDDRDYKPNFNFANVDILDKIYNQKISLADLFYNKFDALPKAEQTAKSLVRLVREYTDFTITVSKAEKVLRKERNPYYVSGHKYLSSKEVPAIPAYGAFYAYQDDDNRQNLLAEALANQQAVVWSTGTHTSTPVLVFAYGPKDGVEPFVNKFLHHSNIGQELINLHK